MRKDNSQSLPSSATTIPTESTDNSVFIAEGKNKLTALSEEFGVQPKVLEQKLSGLYQIDPENPDKLHAFVGKVELQNIKSTLNEIKVSEALQQKTPDTKTPQPYEIPVPLKNQVAGGYEIPVPLATQAAIPPTKQNNTPIKVMPSAIRLTKHDFDSITAQDITKAVADEPKKKTNYDAERVKSVFQKGTSIVSKVLKDLQSIRRSNKAALNPSMPNKDKHSGRSF